MKKNTFRFGGILALVWAIGCSAPVKQVVVETESMPAPVYKVHGPKKRVAIGKFENKTGYGKNLFGRVDTLGTQASDILAAHLVKSGGFIVKEMDFSDMVDMEKAGKTKILEGLSAVIFGSVSEFGVKVEGKDYGLARKKTQTAHCKVNIRMVDPVTKVAFYAEFGEGNAMNEAKEVFGFGERAGYDATLADKALNAAIAKLISNVLKRLDERLWVGRILDVQGDKIFINAGAHSGLTAGDILIVERPGKLLTNKQTGLPVELPGTVIGKIKVVSQFGDSDLNEGSICAIISGSGFAADYYVKVEKE